MFHEAPSLYQLVVSSNVCEVFAELLLFKICLTAFWLNGCWVPGAKRRKDLFLDSYCEPGILFTKVVHIDGLIQERRNSIANTLELRLSCPNPSIWDKGGAFQKHVWALKSKSS